MPVKSSSPAARDRFGLGALLLLVLTFIVYLPAIRGEFLWDDDILIYNNELIHRSDGLKAIWFSTQPHDYFPLTLTTFWFEWRMWAMETFGYHGLNIFLHGVGAVLLWRVLRKINIPGGFVAATLFAVHPVCVASVAWIAERKNTLSLVFFLASLYWYLRSEDSPAATAKPATVDNPPPDAASSPFNQRFYAVSLLLFVGALLSKTSVVMLPVVLLGIALWRRGTIERKDLMRALPFFALSFVFGLVTIWFQTNKAIASESDPTLIRVLGGGWAIWFYLLKALVPIKLTMIYPRWAIDAHAPLAWLGWILWFALLGALYKLRQAWARPVLFALGYFFITLLPVLGVFDMAFFAYSRVADHFQYLSLIGVITLVGAALSMPWGKKVAAPSRRPALTPLSLAAIAACAVLSWNHARIFSSPDLLWSDTIKKNQEAWVAHSNLGMALTAQDATEQAMEYFKTALRLNPKYADAYNNLGSAYSDLKRYDEAVENFRKAMEVRPDYATAENNWGLALIRSGNPVAAMEHFDKALKLSPDFPHAHYNLGVAFAQQGKLAEALEHYRAAVRSNPEYIDARINLGIVLSDTDKLDEAKSEFEEALHLDPEIAEAYNGLGIIMVRKKDYSEAVRYFREAVRLDPENPNMQRNLERAEGLLRAPR